MSNTQLLNHQANGTIFADPADPDYTVRFKTTSSSKVISGVSLQNFVSEIIVNDTNHVVLGSTDVSDKLSIRLRISGSMDSRARLSEIIAALSAQLTTWDAENVYIGFEPTTLPSVPGSA